jgi:hypothetical protein
MTKYIDSKLKTRRRSLALNRSVMQTLVRHDLKAGGHDFKAFLWPKLQRSLGRFSILRVWHCSKCLRITKTTKGFTASECGAWSAKERCSRASHLATLKVHTSLVATFAQATGCDAEELHAHFAKVKVILDKVPEGLVLPGPSCGRLKK